MTPAELHSRILLHELRTILLDDSREGGQIPQEWKDCLTNNPHTPANYLVLGDLLDNEGDPLGELCRIQVELIEKLPVDYWGKGPKQEPRSSDHPFYTDWGTALVTSHSFDWWPTALLNRRLEIVQELYDQKGLNPRFGRLGRTTRMLTDVLRYCELNRGKNILCLHPTPDLVKGQLVGLIEELLMDEPKPEVTPYAGVVFIYSNQILCDYRVRALGARQITSENADITFTDHACPRENRYTQEFAAERQDYDYLTCIGGPHHGQTRQIQRGQATLIYHAHEPVSITDWTEDTFARREAYQIRSYRRERFAFPRRASASRPRINDAYDEHFTYREYLVHEDLTNDQALEMIQSLRLYGSDREQEWPHREEPIDLLNQGPFTEKDFQPPSQTWIDAAKPALDALKETPLDTDD